MSCRDDVCLSVRPSAGPLSIVIDQFDCADTKKRSLCVCIRTVYLETLGLDLEQQRWSWSWSRRRSLGLDLGLIIKKVLTFSRP